MIDRGYATTKRQWVANLKACGTLDTAPWKAPRLTAAGRPFEPAGVEPGAWVEVEDYGRTVRARGQVWSLSPKGVFVVLEDEPRAVEVCVKPSCRRRCGVATHLARPAVALVPTEAVA